ncbi:hypothetical protein WJX81_001737 [Elliptochloris bilobata]|uniref:Uncharacterized protein n=1 Tax=Elliptochloris bilobata TaxID=381761 RepID=A0AAW1QNA1_9CHLO
MSSLKRRCGGKEHAYEFVTKVPGTTHGPQFFMRREDQPAVSLVGCLAFSEHRRLVFAEGRRARHSTTFTVVCPPVTLRIPEFIF